MYKGMLPSASLEHGLSTDMMCAGCVTPIYTIAFVRTISFSTYQKAKYGYDAFSRQAFGISPLESANAKGQYPNIHTFTCFALSGAAAGAVIPIFAGESIHRTWIKDIFSDIKPKPPLNFLS